MYKSILIISVIVMCNWHNATWSSELNEYIESEYTKSFNEKIHTINNCIDVYTNGDVYVAILCSTGRFNIFWGNSDLLYQIKNDPHAVSGGGEFPYDGFSYLDLGNGETETTEYLSHGKKLKKHGFKQEGILKDNILTLNCYSNPLTLHKEKSFAVIKKIQEAVYLPYIPDIKYFLAQRFGQYHYYDEYEFNFIKARYRYFKGEPKNMMEYKVYSVWWGEGSHFIEYTPGGEIDLSTLYPYELEINDEIIIELFGYDVRTEGIPKQFYTDNEELIPYFENPCSIINKMQRNSLTSH